MWSKKRLSVTESTRIRPKPPNPDAFRTTHARSPPKTAKPRRISDHPRPPPPGFPAKPTEAGAPKAQQAGFAPLCDDLGTHHQAPMDRIGAVNHLVGVGEHPLGEANQLPQRTVPLLRCASPRHCTPPPSARSGGQAGQRAPPTALGRAPASRTQTPPRCATPGKPNPPTPPGAARHALDPHSETCGVSSRVHSS